MTKTLAASAAVVVVAAFASATFGAPLDLAKLPQGSVPRAPSKSAAPASLPEGSVMDLHVSQPAHHASLVGPGRTSIQLGVFAEKSYADEYRRDGHSESATRDASRACISTVRVAELGSTVQRWPLHAASMGHVYLEMANGKPAEWVGDGGITAVHVERFAEDGGPHLDVLDAWLDPVSRGTKEIHRTRLPLARVAKSPGGVEIYAARDGATIQFVVRRQNGLGAGGNERLDDMLRGFGDHLTAARGLDSGSVDCGHVRIELDATATSGETATVRAEVVTRVDEEQQGMSIARLAEVVVGAEGATPFRGEIQMRSLNVHLSASQTSSDPQPVFSVSLGWSGKPRSLSF